VAWASPTTPDDADPLLEVVADELARASAALSGASGDRGGAPYYLAAEVVDVQSVQLRAEDGALHGVRRSQSRHVDVDLRLGGPQLDSTHYLRSGNEAAATGGRSLPIADDAEVLRRELWREIDASHKLAADRWAKVQADRGVLVSEEAAWDLAPAPAVVRLDPLTPLTLDEAAWSERLRRVSALLATGGVVRDGAVSLSATSSAVRFASTEGTRLRHGRTDFVLSVSLDTIADDGTVLDLSTIWVGATPDALPGEAALEAEVSSLRDLLGQLARAPEQEPYTGPVLLSDRAAGVFFHEIFGHRVEGHRLKRVDNAQTFRSKLGTPILPSFLDVVDDPTQAEALGVKLNGHYAFDDEGVAAQRVTLVDDGVLVGFLQSRSTITAADASNGHGRRSAGLSPVTRQGNLMVTAERSVSDAELRRQLVAAAKAKGLPYGLFIDRIQGGFTFTERKMPNAFHVNVLEAWRVYVDGRPDELVRGVDLIGTPLDAFSRIVAAGETHDVFNGVCGAESGWVPVSALAPSLLVSQMETQRKGKGQERPPLLPPPGAQPPPARSASAAGGAR
jgi:predicted Zn-dependent protease